MCAYQKETQLLEVEVLGYEAGFMEDFEKQSPRQPIGALQFRPLSPQAFKANLSYYDGLRLAMILANTEPEQPASKVIWTKPREEWEIEMHWEPTDPSPPPLEKPASIHLHFQERIQELSFSGHQSPTCRLQFCRRFPPLEESFAGAIGLKASLNSLFLSLPHE
jgi:hypothetical protein